MALQILAAEAVGEVHSTSAGQQRRVHSRGGGADAMPQPLHSSRYLQRVHGTGPHHWTASRQRQVEPSLLWLFLRNSAPVHFSGETTAALREKFPPLTVAGGTRDDKHFPGHWTGATFAMSRR